MSILQELLSDCIVSPRQLQESLSLSDEYVSRLTAITDRYPIRIPPYYLGLIGPEWESDPIRKMCLPDLKQFSIAGKADTSGEAENTVTTGMQHKYRQTAMILTTNQCSMYCRHCFRKRMVGSSADEVARHLCEMVAYVRELREINNVLLSGGDALVNENARLKQYLEAFSGIGHLRYIRIGTRTPAVLPERVYRDQELLELLESYCSKKQIIIVTHFNHPKELTDEARRAVRALLQAGCPVQNQTVLLKGVNDKSEVLAELMNGLVAAGVLPYYVFQCRPARGVMKQFQVPLLQGQRLIDRAKADMSGQAKAFRYTMSHVTGKIEILGRLGDDRLLFKYHQSKYRKDESRLFSAKLGSEQCWRPETVR